MYDLGPRLCMIFFSSPQIRALKPRKKHCHQKANTLNISKGYWANSSKKIEKSWGGPFLSDSNAQGYTWKPREILRYPGKFRESLVNSVNLGKIPGNPGHEVLVTNKKFNKTKSGKKVQSSIHFHEKTQGIC